MIYLFVIFLQTVTGGYEAKYDGYKHNYVMEKLMQSSLNKKKKKKKKKSNAESDNYDHANCSSNFFVV